MNNDRRVERMHFEPNRDHPANVSLVTQRGIHANETELTWADLLELQRVVNERVAQGPAEPPFAHEHKVPLASWQVASHIRELHGRPAEDIDSWGGLLDWHDGEHEKG